MDHVRVESLEDINSTTKSGHKRANLCFSAGVKAFHRSIFTQDASGERSAPLGSLKQLYL